MMERSNSMASLYNRVGTGGQSKPITIQVCKIKHSWFSVGFLYKLLYVVCAVVLAAINGFAWSSSGLGAISLLSSDVGLSLMVFCVLIALFFLFFAQKYIKQFKKNAYETPSHAKIGEVIRWVNDTTKKTDLLPRADDSTALDGRYSQEPRSPSDLAASSFVVDAAMNPVVPSAADRKKSYYCVVRYCLCREMIQGIQMRNLMEGEPERLHQDVEMIRERYKMEEKSDGYLHTLTNGMKEQVHRSDAALRHHMALSATLDEKQRIRGMRNVILQDFLDNMSEYERMYSKKDTTVDTILRHAITRYLKNKNLICNGLARAGSKEAKQADAAIAEAAQIILKVLAWGPQGTVHSPLPVQQGTSEAEAVARDKVRSHVRELIESESSRLCGGSHRASPSRVRIKKLGFAVCASMLLVVGLAAVILFTPISSFLPASVVGQLATPVAVVVLAILAGISLIGLIAITASRYAEFAQACTRIKLKHKSWVMRRAILLHFKDNKEVYYTLFLNAKFGYPTRTQPTRHLYFVSKLEQYLGLGYHDDPFLQTKDPLEDGWLDDPSPLERSEIESNPWLEGVTQNFEDLKKHDPALAKVSLECAAYAIFAMCDMAYQPKKEGMDEVGTRESYKKYAEHFEQATAVKGLMDQVLESKLKRGEKANPSISTRCMLAIAYVVALFNSGANGILVFALGAKGLQTLCELLGVDPLFLSAHIWLSVSVALAFAIAGVLLSKSFTLRATLKAFRYTFGVVLDAHPQTKVQHVNAKWKFALIVGVAMGVAATFFNVFHVSDTVSILLAWFHNPAFLVSIQPVLNVVLTASVLICSAICATGLYVFIWVMRAQESRHDKSTTESVVKHLGMPKPSFSSFFATVFIPGIGASMMAITTWRAIHGVTALHGFFLLPLFAALLVSAAGITWYLGFRVGVESGYKALEEAIKPSPVLAQIIHPHPGPGHSVVASGWSWRGEGPEPSEGCLVAGPG